MIIEFPKEGTLEESTEGLQRYSALLFDQLETVRLQLIAQIKMLEGVLREPLSARRLDPVSKQRMAKGQKKEKELELGDIFSQIDRTVKQHQQQLQSLHKEQKVKQLPEQKAAKVKVQDQKKIQKEKILQKPPLVPPASQTGKQRAVPRPPVYILKKGQIPQPPQRIRRGQFAPLIRASIQRPKSKAATRPEPQPELKVEPKVQKFDRPLKSKHLTTPSETPLSRQTSVPSISEVTTQPIRMPSPTKIGTAKSIASQLKVFPRKELQLKRITTRELNLTDFDRQQMGYRPKEQQTRLVFLRKLSQHFNAIQNHTSPIPVFSQTYNLVLKLEKALRTEFKKAQTKQAMAWNYYLALYLLECAEGLKNINFEASRESRGGRFLRAQVLSNQLRLVQSSEGLSERMVRRRESECRLAFYRFFVIPGLKKKTDQGNRFHLRALLDLIRLGLLGSKRRLCVFKATDLEHYFG